MSASTRHITFQIKMANAQDITDDITKEEVDLAVLDFCEGWEPEGYGEANATMHYKGLKLDIVAHAVKVEHGTVHLDSVVDDVIGVEDSVSFEVIKPPAPFEPLARLIKFIPSKKLQLVLRSTISDIRQEYDDARRAGTLRRRVSSCCAAIGHSERRWSRARAGFSRS